MLQSQNYELSCNVLQTASHASLICTATLLTGNNRLMQNTRRQLNDTSGATPKQKETPDANILAVLVFMDNTLKGILSSSPLQYMYTSNYFRLYQT
jgi:hypothetical protein